MFCNLNSTVLKWGWNWPCLHSLICVAISLLQYKVEWNPGVRDDMVLLIKWLCEDHSLCTVYCYSKKANFVKEGARPLWFFWSKKELTTAWWSVNPFSYLWRFQHTQSEYGCTWLCSCCPCTQQFLSSFYRRTANLLLLLATFSWEFIDKSLCL